MSEPRMDRLSRMIEEREGLGERIAALENFLAEIVPGEHDSLEIDLLRQQKSAMVQYIVLLSARIRILQLTMVVDQ